MNWAHFLTVMVLGLMLVGPILGVQISRLCRGRDPFRPLKRDGWTR